MPVTTKSTPSRLPTAVRHFSSPVQFCSAAVIFTRCRGGSAAAPIEPIKLEPEQGLELLDDLDVDPERVEPPDRDLLVERLFRTGSAAHRPARSAPRSRTQRRATRRPAEPLHRFYHVNFRSMLRRAALVLCVAPRRSSISTVRIQPESVYVGPHLRPIAMVHAQVQARTSCSSRSPATSRSTRW